MSIEDTCIWSGPKNAAARRLLWVDAFGLFCKAQNYFVELRYCWILLVLQGSFAFRHGWDILHLQQGFAQTRLKTKGEDQTSMIWMNYILFSTCYSYLWILRIILSFFSRIMMDSLKIPTCCAIGGSIQVFRPPFSPPMPHGKRGMKTYVPQGFQGNNSRGARRAGTRWPREDGKIFRVPFLLTQKIGGLGIWKGDEGWIWCFTWFFLENITEVAWTFTSGWQCCWMFVWEGSIVKVAKYVFFLGAWRKDQEKHVCYCCTCMNVKDTPWYSIMTYRLWSLQGLIKIIKYDTMYIT